MRWSVAGSLMHHRQSKTRVLQKELTGKRLPEVLRKELLLVLSVQIQALPSKKPGVRRSARVVVAQKG